jgi:hemolysin activation/secretion protein
MRLDIFPTFTEYPPWNYGGAASAAAAIPHRATVGLLAAFLTLFLLATFSARAEQPNQAGFDPRQAEKHFDDLRSEQSQPARPALRMPSLARPAPQGDNKPLFVLRGVTAVGAAAIPEDQIAKAYQPYLGKMVSQADLAAIASAIGETYRSGGFHLSRAIVPPQDIQGGMVRIEIIEGSITEARLEGEGAEKFGVRALLDPVLAEHPSRFATLERQLLLINGLPGIRIADSALDEIGGTTGRFRLIVKLKVWHIYASFGIDNFGSSAVGPWQSYAAGAFNSYLLPGDTLALNLSTSANDPRELGFGRISYDAPVGADGVRLGMSALYSEVRPGDNRRFFNDNARTEAVEIRGSIMPLQSQRSTLTLTAAAGSSDVSENDVFGPVYNDRIRTVSLTSDYRLQDGFGGNNFATLTWRQGLDILGASRSDDDLLSRFGASGNFSVLGMWFTRYQTLSDAWSVKLSTAGQIASGPLFTSQQFYLGGAAFGRGYGSAEISGDNGVAGSLELRFDQKLDFRYLSSYQLYGFVDAGAVWNDGYDIGDGLSLTSVGGGVRFVLWEDLRADLGVAFPLSYRAPSNESRSARLLFSVSNALKLCPERNQARCL